MRPAIRVCCEPGGGDAVDHEDTLLAAITADPADDTARLALADCLEEQGRPLHGELLRLHGELRRRADGTGPAFDRLCWLIESGVHPVVPTLVNTIGMRFALIPPGTFWMGSPASEADRFSDEGPEHLVEITRPFYLGVFPVTQAEYLRVIGTNPSTFSTTGEMHDRVPDLDTRRHPVDGLSWDLAFAFCQALSTQEANRRYRLPTEAEWEYVCRAGISRTGPFHFGRSLASTQANFDGRYPYGDAPEGPYLRRTAPVDAFPPNAFGIWDMHGNVSEWCSDWFLDHYYDTSPRCDPPGAPAGEHRVLRGGSWSDPGKYCRAAFRYDRPPDEDRYDFGVRVVLEYPDAGLISPSSAADS